MSEAETARDDENDLIICPIVEDGEQCGKKFVTDEHARAGDKHADHLNDEHHDYLQNVLGGVRL